MAKLLNLGRSRYETDAPPEPETGGSDPKPTSPYAYESPYVQYQQQQPAQPPMTLPTDQMPQPTTTPPPTPDVPPPATPQPPTPSWPIPTDAQPQTTNSTAASPWATRINWKYVAMVLGALSVIALLALLVSKRSRSAGL